MKKHFLSLFVLIFSAQLLWTADVTSPSNLPAYYSGYIDNKSGSALFDGIHNVAGIGFSSLSYAGVWVAYKTTDTKADGTTIYDYYSYCSDYTYYSSQDGQAPKNNNEGDCYNREHSIPKSWFGGSTSSGTPGTDLFHLVPADKIVNSLRNNHAYGEVTEANATSKTKQDCGTKENPLDNYNRYGQASSITISNTIISPDASTKTPTVKVFEPLAEYKGDLARGYFGTMIKWAGEKWNDGKEQTFTIGDGAQMFSDGYTAEKLFGLSEYGVALLLKWHREDPVSQREIDRNNGIQETQGNRNPFIDYPILAEYIWGKYSGETFLLTNAVGSFESSFVVGESDGDKNGSVVPTTKYTITWSVKGETSSDKVAQGTRPTAPNVENCSASRVFMGWTTSSSFTGVPSPLYAANEIPNATAAATYYAVFADKEGSGSTSTESVTFSNLYSADTDVENTPISIGTNSSVTFKKGTSNSKYYQSGTSIRWYAGGKCTVSSSSGNISKIVFTFASGGNTNEISTTIGTYNDNDGIWQGDANSVEFTQAGTSGHRRIASISVTSGTEASYSNYNTMCETCTPTMPEVSFAASEKSTTCGGEVTNALNKGGSEGTVTYTSSNTSVATVGKSTGSVTIISAGTTIITANVAASGCYSSALASYTLTVNRENAMVNFTSPTTELQEKLKTTNEAYTSSDAEISYASNNESVAIVDVETGEVTAIAPGIARITASVAQTGCYNEASAYYDLSVTAIPTYTVTWKANGETVWVTENVKTDDLYSLPDNPANCSEERVFMGWTVEKDYESETTAPSLITSIYQAPILTQDTTIYAVYADKKTDSELSASYNRITSTSELEAGDYLIVYETGNLAFNGGLETLDAVSNTISVTITDYTIESTSETDAAVFTLAKSGGNYTIRSASGYYIGQTSDANGLGTNASSSTYTNTITFESDGSVNIVSSDARLRYNNATNQTRFRYYKSTSYTSQKAIYLYKKVTSGSGTGTTYSNYSTKCSDKITVTFHNNYGVDATTTQVMDVNKSTALTANPWSREHYTFSGWALSTDGSKVYDDGENVSLDEDVDLYALWVEDPKYTVTCYSNGDKVGEVKGYAGEEIVIYDPAACEDYTFVGWSTSTCPTEVTIKPSIIVPSVIPEYDVTYYAIFSRQVSGGATYTDKYQKITETTELTTANYIIAAYYNSGYGAMSTTWKDTYYLAPTEVTPNAQDIITTSDGTIIWNLTVVGNMVSIYNETAKYLYIEKSTKGTSTFYNVKLGDNTTDNKYTFSVDEGNWLFRSVTYNDRVLEFYTGDKYRWAFYSSPDAPIYLYKQQIDEGYTTYYSSSPSCSSAPTAVENVESVQNARKVLINGKMYIFIGEHCYDVTGKRIR